MSDVVSMPNRRPSSVATGMDSMCRPSSCISAQAWCTVTACESTGGVSKSRSRTCVRTVRSSGGGAKPNLSSTSCVWSLMPPMRAAVYARSPSALRSEA